MGGRGTAAVVSISIVTPSFNQAEYLREALDSVACQDYPALEHLVFDGQSTDGSAQLLNEYSHRPDASHLHWVSEKDDGQSDALNKGFRAARGDVIGWLNADDRYLPGCFRSVAEFFERNPDVDLVYGDFRWIDTAGRVLQVRREIAFSRFVLMYHHVLFVPSTATFIRRRIFEEGNFLDLSYHYAMDFEFFLRLSQGGYHFRHLAKLLADFRWQRESKSSRGVEPQRREVERAVFFHSPVLRACGAGFLGRRVLRCLRTVAQTRRWSEKALRGYYLTQFRQRTR